MELLIYFSGAVLGGFLNRCIEVLPRCRVVISSGTTACGLPDDHFTGSRVRRVFVIGLTGGMMALAYAVFGVRVELLRAAVFLSFLIVVAMIDYDHQLVLDKVLLAMGAAGVATRIVCAGTMALSWGDQIIGFFLGGALLLAIAIASCGGMGGGDIKLAAVIGLWGGWQFALLTLFLSFLIGGICAMGLLLSGARGRKDCIPFAPFIAIAAAVTYLYGDALMFWYTGWL